MEESKGMSVCAHYFYAGRVSAVSNIFISSSEFEVKSVNIYNDCEF